VLLEGTENVLQNVEAESVGFNGTRNLVNGRGVNAGPPGSGGDWNGYAAYAEQQDATIHDTNNNNLFEAVGGAWVQI